MKNLYKICGIFCLSFLAFACEDLTEINTRETTIYEIDPANHFYVASSSIKGSSFEFFYDYSRGMLPWMQYTVGREGNAATFVNYSSSNNGARYERYTDAGGYVKDIEEYVKSHYTEVEQASFGNIIQISKILMIYQGIYTSDSFGSLVYDEGWQARYGGITDPSFQQQKDLYLEWDNELKQAITRLKSNVNQRSLGGYDVAYSGNKDQWIKAANALRLRLALRWVKQDINKAKAIATEVLQSNADELFSKTSDGWIFRFETIFTEHGNYADVQENYRASYSMINYMKAKSDPRLRMFFKKNTYTAANVALWNSQNPGSVITYNPDQYVGGHADPYARAASNRNIAPEYGTPNREIIRPDNSKETLDTISRAQERHFQATYDQGKGISWFPCITYADFCFMAAEFSSYGVTSSKSIQAWYEEGVRSSLDFWNGISKDAAIDSYTAMTNAEIDAYMNMDGVKWNASKALDQIACQSFIDNFKNTNEAWTTWKRLGYPNATSTLPVEVLHDDEGVSTLVLPRRHAFNYPLAGTVNYDNYKKRLDVMATDPDFGAVNDATGRIWWDKK